MKFIIRCLFMLLAATSICHGSNWYVSTNGSGNGSIGSPWSLQTAITSSSIQPGDTVWLRNGTYEPTTTFPDLDVNRLGWKPSITGNASSLITFASYSNEWAQIDRVWYLAGYSCGYLCFSNLEFFDSLKGHNLTNSQNPCGGCSGSVPWVHFPLGGNTGFQWVNCLIHDVNNCWGNGGGATSIRGNVIWYVGWDILEHVCYPAPASLTGNICAWHYQNVVNFNTQDFICQSNIIFGGGDTVASPVNANTDIFGSGYNENISYNYFYNRIGTAVQAIAMSFGGSATTSLTVNSNVIVNALPVYWASSANGAYNAVTFTSNVVYGSDNNANASYSLQSYKVGSTSGFTINHNSYYSTAPMAPSFNYNGSGDSFAQWQTTGLDANSSAYSGTKPPYATYVIPNQDVKKRANIAVYNWPLSNNVTVNLSSVLNAGDSYNLYSAQNYKAGPIQSGIYNGTSISIPMTGLTVAPILYGANLNAWGEIIAQPPSPSPEFGAFVVIGSSGNPQTLSLPTLSWTTPASIVYGTALSASQLDATANVPGSFAYVPAAGTILNKGANTLSVIFTPADTIDYSSATNSVSLVVSPAPLGVTANNATRQPGAANPVFTGTITGVRNGDNITATYSCSATAGSPSGTYPIVPSLVDPNNRQTNYTVSLTNGTLNIAPTPPASLHIVLQ
jgi:hypothetical protein